MSMKTSIIYGFGFHCDCNDEALIEFIKKHKESFCKSNEEKKLYSDMLDYTKNEYDLENFFENYCCDSTGSEGYGAVISNIISRETEIRFSFRPAADDYGTLASVVFEESYPWQLNETEKTLDEETLFDICKKYMDELKIDEKPDYLSLEYYGEVKQVTRIIELSEEEAYSAFDMERETPIFKPRFI